MSRISVFLWVALCMVSLRKVHADSEGKEIDEALVPIIAECSKEHGAKADDVMASKKSGDFNAIDGCLIECVYKKMGLLDDSGAFDVDKLVESAKKFMSGADPDKLEEVVKRCTSGENSGQFSTNVIVVLRISSNIKKKLRNLRLIKTNHK